MDKIYRGIGDPVNENKKNNHDKSAIVYRGSSSVLNDKKKNVDQDDLVYRGVSKDTSYYTLAKIRSFQKKRKLFHAGLEIYAGRKYSHHYK